MTDSDPMAPESVTPAAQLAPGSVGTIADPATADIPRPGCLPTPAQEAAARKDKVLSSQASIDLAHEALGQITEPLSVGAHVGMRSEDTRIVTHLFDCNLAGYRGWRWAVTMTRPARARMGTICEMELLPGEDAVLTPPWIPWADRLQPGDISRSDRLPRRETDERLEPGWEATQAHEGDAAGTDALDFGRPRVLSARGVQQAATRWYAGDHGPNADGVRKARATCSTCGFLMPLAGPLRNIFGLCANEWAVDDGRVVSLDHGCGAHSETDLVDQGTNWPVMPSRLDEAALEPLGTDGSSIRGGRSQQEIADAAAPVGSQGVATVGEDSPAEAQEGACDGAQEAEAATATRGRKTRRSRSARVSEGKVERAVEHSGEHETDDAGESAAPRERQHNRREQGPATAHTPSSAASFDPQDRHAAALDAIAELAAARGGAARRKASGGDLPDDHGEHDAGQGDAAASEINSLADLEAHLPFRA